MAYGKGQGKMPMHKRKKERKIGYEYAKSYTIQTHPERITPVVLPAQMARERKMRVEPTYMGLLRTLKGKCTMRSQGTHRSLRIFPCSFPTCAQRERVKREREREREFADEKEREREFSKSLGAHENLYLHEDIKVVTIVSSNDPERPAPIDLIQYNK